MQPGEGSDVALLTHAPVMIGGLAADFPRQDGQAAGSAPAMMPAWTMSLTRRRVGRAERNYMIHASLLDGFSTPTR